MHTARIIVKVLALFGGFGGLCGAAASLVMLAAIVTGHFPMPRSPLQTGTAIFMTSMFALFAVIAYLMFRQGWIHWRRPTRSNARTIVAITTFLLVVRILTFLEKQRLTDAAERTFGPIGDLGVKLAIIAAAVILYRRLLRRVADRAYPEPTDAPAPFVKQSF